MVSQGLALRSAIRGPAAVAEISEVVAYACQSGVTLRVMPDRSHHSGALRLGEGGPRGRLLQHLLVHQHFEVERDFFAGQPAQL
jgi:hypothetical protein